MPTYPYVCEVCRKRFAVFLSYAEYDQAAVACSHCGSRRVRRRIGRVRFARSQESRMEGLADVGDLAGLEDDPRAMAKAFRQMGDELGEDIGPEFNEVVSRLESGQSPEEIERDLPGLMDDDGGGLDADF